MLTFLLPELHEIILSYMCPTEDVDVLHALDTKFKKSLIKWTKSLEITTNELFGGKLCRVTRVNKKLHRAEGSDEPAIEYIDNWSKRWGSKEWYIDGKRHRNHDNPAIVHSDGSKE